MSFRFAFLVLEEHPYGREMLRILLENELLPSLIIQEVSAVGDEEREKFMERIAGQLVPPRLTQLVSGMNIPTYSVANHNDESCKELLAADQPDLLVLGGTRIIKPSIFNIPRLATVNSHPGLLPWLRGSASVGWALYKDLPQGATVHFIDEGIDTGDVIASRLLPVYRNDSYESLNSRIAVLAGELMPEVVVSIVQGNFQRMQKDPGVGETLRVIPDEL